MKKIFFLIILSFQFQIVTSQTTFTENEKLFATAKIWGFLKYYHPQVSKGKFDWDKQLIEQIPKILQTNSKKELNKLFLNWINSLGKVKHKKSNEKLDNIAFIKNFDLTWLSNNYYFNKELVETLKNIEINRNKGKKYYVKQKISIGNVTIDNENRYQESNLSQEEFRLLVLFRYWNIIEYFYPYKYQTDQNWDSVLKEMIPKFREANTETKFHLTILELITKIDDSHAFLLEEYKPNYFGKYWAPFKFRIIENQVIITGFYNKDLTNLNDLKIGDIISEIEGVNAMDVLNDKLKYIPASNKIGKYRNAFKVLFNGDSNTIKLTIERDKKLIKKEVKRYTFSEFNYKFKPLHKKWEIKKGNIGYINLVDVKTDSIFEIMQSLKNTKALILDLRNGVFDLWGGIGQFLKSQRSPFVKILKPDISYPGKYHFLETKRCCYQRDDIYKGKVILLVNEYVQSHAEFTGMVFQTGDNVTTIGSQTAGADGNVSYIPLIGNYKTLMTGVGLFYPDGTETQRKGLKIDIVVKPTINGIRNNRDEVLERAIEFAN